MWPGVESGSLRSQRKAIELGVESGRRWGLWQCCEATPAGRARGQGRGLSRTDRPRTQETQE